MTVTLTPASPLCDRVTTIARRLGIEKFDLGGSHVDEVSVQVQQGEPKQVKASQRSGITVRVWNATGRLGVASTTQLDDCGLETALEMAKEASAFGVTEDIPDFSPWPQRPLGRQQERRLMYPLPLQKLSWINSLRRSETSWDATQRLPACPTMA